MAKQFFIGAKRSSGSMLAEDKRSQIVWDNVVIHRIAEVDPDSNAGGGGYEVLTPCKIKAVDFERVTGLTLDEFMSSIPNHFMAPIVVYFGELRGAKDDRKADTEFFRFVGPDGQIRV